MKFSYETQGAINYLVCELEDETPDSLTLGMLTNNHISGLSEVLYTEINGVRYLKYNISAKITSERFFGAEIKRERALTALSNILSPICSCDEYMIEPSCFEVAAERIFLNVSSCETGLICVPVINGRNIHTAVSDFFKATLEEIKPAAGEDTSYLEKIKSFLDEPTYTIYTLNDFLNELKKQPATAPEAQPSPNVQDKPRIMPQSASPMNLTISIDDMPNLAGASEAPKENTFDAPSEMYAPQRNAFSPQSNMQGNMQSGVRPGGFNNSQGNIQGGVRPGGFNNSQGNMQSGVRPGGSNNSQGNMQGGVRPGGSNNSQGNMQGGVRPGGFNIPQGDMQNSLRPGPLNNVQGNMQSNMRGNMQSNMRGNMQSNMRGNMQGSGIPTQAKGGVMPNQNVPPKRQAAPSGDAPFAIPGQSRPNTAGKQPTPQPQPAQSEGKKISFLGLLAHYNKENAELYKNQKNAAKAAKKNAAEQKKNAAPKPNAQATPPQPNAPFAAPQPNATSGNAPFANRGNGYYAPAATPKPMSYTPPMTPLPVSNDFNETTVLSPISTSGETTVLNASSAAPTAMLTRIRTGERVAVNKPIFRIGKEKSYVDYFIADNTAISRSHANIHIDNGEYFIEDTNSRNHTYLNGVLINSNVKVKLAFGDKLRFANEDFIFSSF